MPEKHVLNYYEFCGNQMISRFDVRGLAAYKWGPAPETPGFNFDDRPIDAEPGYCMWVSYTPTPEEKCKCSRIVVRRYVTAFLWGGGPFGIWISDGNSETFTAEDGSRWKEHKTMKVGNKWYAPCDRPEGPGGSLYRLRWLWRFKFKVKCLEGEMKGRILAEETRWWWCSGHSEDEEPEGGWVDWSWFEALGD